MLDDAMTRAAIIDDLEGRIPTGGVVAIPEALYRQVLAALRPQQAPASGASDLEGRLRDVADPDGRIPLPIMNQEGSRAGVARRTPEEISRVEAFRDERGTVWMPSTAWAYFSACRARDTAADALASARAEIAGLRAALEDFCLAAEYWAGCDEGCDADTASSEIMRSGGSWPAQSYDAARTFLANQETPDAG